VLAGAPAASAPPEVALLCSRYCFESLEDLQGTLPGRALLRGLRGGGYVEGKDVVLDFRASNVGPDLPRHAAGVARRSPAVILAFSDDGVRAARGATTTVPIVMVAVNDAVEHGIVASLARPDGNVTGVSVPTREVATKRLELLGEMVPGVSKVAVLVNESNPAHPLIWRETEAAAKRLGIAVQRLTAQGEADFGAVFAAIGPARPVGLLVLGDPLLFGSRNRGQLTQRALAAKVALVGPTREYVQSLALLTYEASRSEMFERAGALVAKVLRGARPADLPVEEPTRYDLFVSETAARTLRLTVPPSIRARAEMLP